MNITINQITPRRENNEITSIQVNFTARTLDGTISLSGNIPIDEFGNSVDLISLEKSVRDALVKRIMTGEDSEE